VRVCGCVCESERKKEREENLKKVRINTCGACVRERKKTEYFLDREVPTDYMCVYLCVYIKEIEKVNVGVRYVGFCVGVRYVGFCVGVSACVGVYVLSAKEQS
jgi:hypothetical protein